MPDNDMPAATDPAANTNGSPAAGSGEQKNEPKPVDVAKLVGAVQRANRMVDELSKEFEELKAWKKSSDKQPSAPPGVEERLAKLSAELEAERKARNEERLKRNIMEAAAKHGVDPARLDYLEYRLRSNHPGLEPDGVVDSSNPSAKISIDTLVVSLLSSQDGAVFRPAPAAGNLPPAGSDKTAAKKTMKLSEWNALAKRGGSDYAAAHAAVRKGDLVLVDD